jgi:hypothetical protein
MWDCSPYTPLMSRFAVTGACSRTWRLPVVKTVDWRLRSADSGTREPLGWTAAIPKGLRLLMNGKSDRNLASFFPFLRMTRKPAGFERFRVSIECSSCDLEREFKFQTDSCSASFILNRNKKCQTVLQRCEDPIYSRPRRPRPPLFQSPSSPREHAHQRKHRYVF